MAWEHGGGDFQVRFDKATAQAEQMKEGVLRVLWRKSNFHSLLIDGVSPLKIPNLLRIIEYQNQFIADCLTPQPTRVGSLSPVRHIN